MSQLKILLMLAAGGGASGQELQRFMGVSLATVTGIVDRLVAQDLVERREDPADRRVRRIELTTHGTEIIEGIVTAGMERQQRLLQRLTVPELETIERGIHILVKAAYAENAACATIAGAENSAAAESSVATESSVAAERGADDGTHALNEA